MSVSFNFQSLQESLDAGRSLPLPDGVLINGQTHSTFSGDQGYFGTRFFRFGSFTLSIFSFQLCKETQH